jgi:hypothetical protein
VDKEHNQAVKMSEVGMAFKPENDAYKMHNSYDRNIGFRCSIRKSNTRQRGSNEPR